MKMVIPFLLELKLKASLFCEKLFLKTGYPLKMAFSLSFSSMSLSEHQGLLGNTLN